MRRSLLLILAAVIVMVFGLATVSVMAAGSHDVLNCAGCHNIHYAVGYKAFAVVNDKAQNPKSKTAIDGVSALCLGCHENPENGGAGLKPVNMHTTHPVNVAPNGRIAKVPAGALYEGKLQCTSCHDPHPSNAGYRYLRVDTKDGGEMPTFCAMCHPAKVDLSILKGGLQVFSSMDETKGANYAPADQQVYTNPTENYYGKK